MGEQFDKMMRVPKAIKLFNRNTSAEFELILKPLPIKFGNDLRKFFRIIASRVKDDSELSEVEAILIDDLIQETLKVSYPDWSEEQRFEIGFIYNVPLMAGIIDVNAPYSPDKVMVEQIKKMKEQDGK